MQQAQTSSFSAVHLFDSIFSKLPADVSLNDSQEVRLQRRQRRQQGTRGVDAEQEGEENGGETEGIVNLLNAAQNNKLNKMPMPWQQPKDANFDIHRAAESKKKMAALTMELDQATQEALNFVVPNNDDDDDDEDGQSQVGGSKKKKKDGAIAEGSERVGVEERQGVARLMDGSSPLIKGSQEETENGQFVEQKRGMGGSIHTPADMMGKPSTAPSTENYFHLIAADDGKLHRGRCCMYHQEKGFGFIEPIFPSHLWSQIPEPARTQLKRGSLKVPDVYFTKEDVVVHPNAIPEELLENQGPSPQPEEEQTALQKNNDAPPPQTDLEALQQAFHTICVGEEIEFYVSVNKLAVQGGAGALRRLRALRITGPQGLPVQVQSSKQRRRGVIRHWNSGGIPYGFITPNEGGRDVFFHGAAICWSPSVPESERTVQLGFVVEYTPVVQKERGGGGGNKSTKRVAYTITDANFKPIHPASILQSASVVQAQLERKEKENEKRKRLRAEAEGDGFLDVDDVGGGSSSTGPGGRRKADPMFVHGTEDDSYVTW